MSRFAWMPSGAVLVQATVLVGSLGAAEEAVSQSLIPEVEESERWRAAREDLNRLSTTDTHVTLAAFGTGVTSQQAVDDATLQAHRRLLLHLLGRPDAVAKPTLLDVTSRLQAFAVAVDQVLVEGQGESMQAVVRVRVERFAWEVATARYRSTVTVAGRTFAESVFGGIYVVARDHEGGRAVSLVEGDRLVTIEGAPVQGLADVHRLKRARVAEVWRDGVTLRRKLTKPHRPPPTDAIAPTCGPCCHGHCDDFELDLRVPRGWP
ncbi:MAG: hypothetical protein KTR31_10965 [Myxococcales bacterium]|nr:hypothetical protein [Myxococcales bacterium]